MEDQTEKDAIKYRCHPGIDRALFERRFGLVESVPYKQACCERILRGSPPTVPTVTTRSHEISEETRVQRLTSIDTQAEDMEGSSSTSRPAKAPPATPRPRFSLMPTASKTLQLLPSSTDPKVSGLRSCVHLRSPQY